MNIFREIALKEPKASLIGPKRAKIEKAGCEKVYSEHKSGIKARLELAEAIKYLRKGDNYIAEITVYENNENDSNTNNMKIIIQLLDDTNFKILFQN